MLDPKHIPDRKPKKKLVAQQALVEEIPPEIDPELAEFLRPLENPHDEYTCSHLRIKRFAIAFLKAFLSKKKFFPALDLQNLTIDERQIYNDKVFKDAYADVRYSIPLVGEPEQSTQVVVLIEHKSYNDKLAILQLAYYMALTLFQASPKWTKAKRRTKKSQIKTADTVKAVESKETDKSAKSKKSAKEKDEEQLLPPIIPIIIHHGPTKYTGPTRLSQLYKQVKGMEKLFLDFEPIIIDLNKIAFEKLPNDPNEWRLNIVLRMIKAASMKKLDFNQVIDNFSRLFQHDPSKDPDTRRFTCFTIRYFTDGSNVAPDTFLPYIKQNCPNTDEGVSKMTMTMAQQLIQKGFEKGRDEGRVTWFEEGRKEGREEEREEGLERNLVSHRKILITMLKKKFNRVPKTILNRILWIHDDIVLQSLFISVMDCDTLDEFCECLL